jgi:osmotically inducible protein OsmC
MAVRTGQAVWEGDLRNGKGTMRFGSGAFEGQYSFLSRFEEGKGTNPEELIGAAHAGCFSMSLSNTLAEAGFTPKRVNTIARVHIDKVGPGFKITLIELNTEALVPGIDNQKFQKVAENASKNCPVSQALASTQIRMVARLVTESAKVGR